ncbi:MAG: hypothetical protein ACRC6E_12150 [Fusobacteriaceae bacterium]
MKKIWNVVLITLLLVVTACSSLTKKDDQKTYTKEEVKNWEITIAESLKKNALIPEWYGEENPVFYLRKTGKMTEKEFMFLTQLDKKEVTDEDVEEFTSIVKKYNSKIERKFSLNDENIKNPKGLVDRIVSESYLRMTTPSSHIAKEVATPKEWETIISFSKKTDLNSKETTELRKILNKFIKRNEFFEPKSWYNREVSNRMNVIVKIHNKEKKTSVEKNNVNAKALYLAYPEFFSNMDKWND